MTVLSTKKRKTFSEYLILLCLFSFAFSFNAQAQCDDLTDGGEIGYDQSYAEGSTPFEILDIATPSGGTGEIEYLWMYSTDGVNWNPIPNSNSPSYQPGTLYQTTYYIRCARREGCASFIAESNIVIIQIGDDFNLAVELATFNASLLNESEVLLKWNTYTETDNSHFVIERSSDGEKFVEIDQVIGAGNSTTNIDYSFIDKTPKEGLNYYRLAIYDYFGMVEYSEIVTIKTEVKKQITFNAFPNPFTAYFILETTDVDVNYINITDAAGQLIKTIIPISDQTMIPMEAFPNGMYFMQLITPTEIRTEKIIKK